MELRQFTMELCQFTPVEDLVLQYQLPPPRPPDLRETLKRRCRSYKDSAMDSVAVALLTVPRVPAVQTELPSS